MFVTRPNTAIAALIIGVASCAAAPAAAQEEYYRERQVLDPETGEWTDRAAPAAEAVDGVVGEARLLLVQDEPRAAQKLLEAWIADNPDDARYFEAVYLLGECEFQRGDYWAAYEQLELVVESTAGELFYKALQREMDVARAFLAGRKRIVWKVLRLPAYDDGIQILDRVWERAPGTRIGEEALKLKADYFFAVGDMDLAQDEYVALAREHPNGRFVQLAMIRSAESAAASFPGVKFDDRALVEAEERYQQVITVFPAFAEREQAPARLEGIRNQRADKDLDIAKWYEKTRRPDAATYYYRLVVADYPNTLAAAEATGRLRTLGAAGATAGEAPEATEDRPGQAPPPEAAETSIQPEDVE